MLRLLLLKWMRVRIQACKELSYFAAYRNTVWWILSCYLYCKTTFDQQLNLMSQTDPLTQNTNTLYGCSEVIYSKQVKRHFVVFLSCMYLYLKLLALNLLYVKCFHRHSILFLSVADNTEMTINHFIWLYFIDQSAPSTRTICFTKVDMNLLMTLWGKYSQIMYKLIWSTNIFW